MPVSLNTVKWIHGAADCATCTDPSFRCIRSTRTRSSCGRASASASKVRSCTSCSAIERVTLFDTGAGPDDSTEARILPLRATVEQIIEQWRRDTEAAPWS